MSDSRPQPTARRPFTAALILATALAALDLLLGSTDLAALLVVAPLVAAAAPEPRRTAAAAGYALALAIALGAADGSLGDSDHMLQTLAVTAGGAMAVWISRLRAMRELDAVQLRIQYSVAHTLYESRSLEEAAPGLLEAIGRPFGWEVGGLWSVGRTRVLRCVESWYAPGLDPSGFDKLSRRYVLRPGVGLPGRIWESGAPGWMPDVIEDRDSPRAELASRSGLRGAVGFPLLATGHVVGVIEFFTRESREPDSRMLELMEAVGSQVGEFIERQLAADALEASEARKGAMLESALDCVITIDHEGNVVEFNPAAEQTFGYAHGDALGNELAELIIPPDLRDRHRDALRRTVETGEARILGQRLELTGMRADGSEFPVELAVSRIGGTEPPMFTAYLRDITERRQAEEERERLLDLERIARVDATQARDQLAAILGGVADGVVALAPDGELIFANEAAAAMGDFAAAEDLIQASFREMLDRVEVLDERGGLLPLEELPFAEALGGSQPRDTSIGIRKRRTGEERWVVVKTTPIHDERGSVTMWINVLEDVTEHRRRERVQRVLAETGRVLATSLEARDMLDQMVRLLVPELADWCVVYLTADTGRPIEAAAMRFDDPEKEELVRHELDLYPTDPDGVAGLARVVRSGRPELLAEVDEAAMRELAQDETHLKLIQAEAMRSRILVPLSSHEHIYGAISLATSGSGRGFDEDDLTLAEEIGRRTGSALENARLYAERSYVATTLQRSLLPRDLPAIPGVETAARFRPTGAGNEVGGDFYDLFETGSGHWAVVVGDVCGKGPEAAAVTALARYTLRAAGMRERRPSHSLEILNEALLRQRTDLRFCTVAYAHVETRASGMRVTFASGGHPLPLVLRADGSVEWLGTHGTLMGVVSDPDLVDSETDLGPGDAIVFYTDGVSEARGEQGSLDEASLAELLGECAGLGADAIATRFESEALDIQAGSPRDDIALVVLRVGEGASKRRGRTLADVGATQGFG